MNSLAKDFQRVVDAICIDACTPRALTVFLLCKYGEWDQLAGLRVDPVTYVNVSVKGYKSVLGFSSVGTLRTSFQLKQDLQVSELMRKLVDLPLNTDPKAAARDTFFRAEKLCAQTNLRFSRIRHNSNQTESEMRLFPFLERVRANVHAILGPIPRELGFGFGKGSTFSDRDSHITVGHKMENDGSRTSSTTDYLPLWGESAWARARIDGDFGPYVPPIVQGNRFFSVPKTALEERGACCEPSLNLFFQKGVGTHVRKRLALFGIDLELGQTLHRQLAEHASIHGHLATVDLSMASDTLSREVVRFCLPSDWWTLFDDFRSKKTFILDKWHYLEKFSSMGNGFTFELETAIFYAIALASVDRKVTYGGYPDVKVYGDDIIVPSTCGRVLVGALSFFGFSPNPKKTFLTGVFRESCGGDFFAGHNVRGVNLEDIPAEPHQWISLANQLSGMAERHYFIDVGSSPLRRAWHRVLDALPSDIRRNRGPRLLGDLVVADSNESLWVTRMGQSYCPNDPDENLRGRTVFPGNSQTQFIRVWKPTGKVYPFKRFRDEVQFAMALLGVPPAGPGVRRSGREVLSFKTAWLPVHGVVGL